MIHRRKAYRPTDPRTSARIRLLSAGEAMRLQIAVSSFSWWLETVSSIALRTP